MIARFKKSSIHYSVTGKGKCIVLLHGFLLNTDIWSDLIPLFSKKNKIIAIDLPGHGKSDCIEEICTMELMADIVNFILVENNLKTTSLIGHSMGGYVSLAFLEKYQSKVNNLVLLNSSTEEDSIERKKTRESALKVVSINKTIFIKKAIRSLFPQKKYLVYKDLIELLTEDALKLSQKAIIASINGMILRRDRTKILKLFNGEKYIISGIEDPIIPFSDAIKVAINSDAELIKVDSGHMSVTENNDEIIEVMKKIGFI
jgi:pimeloyl-ACP methyl ester carboxylesterase